VSREPAATNCPFEEMETEVTPASLFSESGSLMVRTLAHRYLIPQNEVNEQPTLGGESRLFISQILTVLSPDPDASKRPSRENSNE